MRAAVCTVYGAPEVLTIADRPRPTPGRDEVLVRVVAAAVTTGDARIRGARFPRRFSVLGRLALGVRRPRQPVLGNSFSGVIEAVGERVDDVRPGDEVAGMTGMRMGAHAEFAVASAKRVTPKPAGVTHEQAAGVLFGGTTALHFLRGLLPLSGRVLVNGATGSIGTTAVQLAARRSATVTAVCSERNADLARRLGAAEVVDYTTTDVATLGERFDIVLDAVGTLGLKRGRRLTTPTGALLLPTPTLAETLRARGRVRAGTSGERREDMERLLDLVATGELAVVLEPVHSLDDIVAAHRVVDSGHKVGNLVVRV